MTYLLTRLAYSLEIPLHGQKCLGFRALDETKKVGGGGAKNATERDDDLSSTGLICTIEVGSRPPFRHWRIWF